MWLQKTNKDKRLAYQDFYQKSFKPLVSHLRRLGIKNQADLEDIIQETYLEAYRSWESLKDAAAGVAWVLTIGRRQMFKHFRKQTERQNNIQDNFDFEGIVDESIFCPAENMENRTMTHTIIQEIGMIKDERKKRAIQLFYLEDANLTDIAHSTGVNASTLTTWFSRFRQDMRKTMLRRNSQKGFFDVAPVLPINRRLRAKR
ncbi:MAG: RNA polymerase sigma factor [Oligoflexales bacterium]